MDGINVTAPETGSAWLDVNVDNIEEIQVYGTGAPAEYGSHTGAVLNVVTKKGGNEFSGGASYYGQWDALTDNNVLADTDSGDSLRYGVADLHRVLPRRIPRVQREDRRSHRQGSNLVLRFGTVLSEQHLRPGDHRRAARETRRTARDRFDFKATAKIGERHELSGLVHADEWGGGVSPSPFYTQSANVEETGSNPAWGATWTSILSDQSLLELKYAGWWSDDIYQSATQSFDEPFIDYTPEQGGPTRYSGGLWFPWDYTTWRQQFNAKVTTYADDFLNAQHDLRFGVQFSKGSAFTNRGIGPNGTYAYNYYGYTYRSYQDPVPVRWNDARIWASSSTTR